jgi:hypothetical protein
MLGMPDQAPVDSERVEDRTERFQTGIAGVIEPGMNGLSTGVDDCGETPPHKLTEPSDKGETLGNVAVEVGLIMRPPSFRPVEVEDDKGSGLDVRVTPCYAPGLPCRRSRHRADLRNGGAKQFLRGAPSPPVILSRLKYFASPEQGIRRKQRREKQAGVVGGIVGTGRRVLPDFRAIPLEP